jgi:hypothetical protein
MSWEHAAEARAALNAIVTDPQHGVGALSSAQTMSNLLKDLLPDAPREKSILVAAAEAGLADTLRQHVGQGMDPDTAIRLTSSSFSSTTPFTPEACSWVTGEIATALGMSHSSTSGAASGAAAGFNPIGQQGMPTQIAPTPRSAGGYPPGQQPAQGFGAVGGQGGYGGSGAAAETRPGQWPPAGGFGGQPGRPVGGQPGGPVGGQPIAPGAQPGGYGQAQPGFGAQQAGSAWQAGAPAAPGAPGAPGGYGPPGQPGFGGQQGVAGWQPGGGYGPGAPTGPIGPGGPIKPRGNKRGLFVAGGLVVVLIVAIVVGTSLAGGKKPTPSPSPGGASSSPITSPSSPGSPVANHPQGTEALQTIMNPPSPFKPVGTQCVAAHLFGLNKATLDASTFCAHTQRANIVVWGYQFDSSADYQAGLTHINHFVGFDKVTPGTTCPPPSGSTTGKIGWHAKSNPKYKSRTGQDIECLIDNNKPVLIWTMPTQDAFFIGQDNLKGSSIQTIVSWWEILNYG